MRNGILLGFLVVLLCTTVLLSCSTAIQTPLVTPSLTFPSTVTLASTLKPLSSDTPLPLIFDAYGAEMVLIPEGEFIMGREDGGLDEQPAHEVYLDAFYIDKFEVSILMYNRCVDAGVCQSVTIVNPCCDPNIGTHPIYDVTWFMASTYCEWREARLPTEAEWEKAARGTDNRLYPWGNEFNGSITNYCDSNCSGSVNTNYDDGYIQDAPVGTYPQGMSPYDVYDMGGNISEWVYDWKSITYYTESPAENPTGPETGKYRVVRGGSWDSDENAVTVTDRNSYDPYTNNLVIGFRCARNASSVSSSMIPTLTTTPTARKVTPYPTVDTSQGTPTLNPALARVLTETPDFRSFVTRTPSQPQQCPEVDLSILPEMPKDPFEAPRGYSYSEAILEFLNAGGSPESLHNHLGWNSRFWAEQDLTGDGVPELIVSVSGANVFMCDHGLYTIPLFEPLDGDPPGPTIMAIQDMNLDGIPELVLEDEIMSAGVRSYKILEWNGKEFQNLTWPGQDLYAWYFTPKGRGLNWYSFWRPDFLYAQDRIKGIASRAVIQDVDGDNMQELVIYQQVPPVRHRGETSPWRETIDTYRWNGVIFMWDKVEIAPPVYRFEAVQDGDRMSLLGEYQEALELYQAAIFSDKLAAWSPENYRQQMYAENQGLVTPTPIPFIQDEYDNLAAYARYRIMLLHFLQGDLESARVVYETLQEKFPEGTPGYPYAAMATAFWQAYHSSGDIKNACSSVIEYAEENKDYIFTYLGNTEYHYDDSHGAQSHYYVTWDMCPFE